MYKLLIAKYKNFRKQLYLNTIGRYHSKYAFIGTGIHSLTNLYPCIENLGAPLHVICSANIANAQKLCNKFPGSVPTSNAEEIFQSPGIKGIFISTLPSLHFSFLKTAFAAGKHVFIEKPPCSTLTELKELIDLQRNSICMVGLQRRFSTITQLIRRHKLTEKTLSYSYRYCTGLYPEGDSLTQLFIHPVDNSIRLFGPVESLQVQKKGDDNEVTFHLLLKHEKGVHGMIELSTRYSWTSPIETMEINTRNSIIHINYPNELKVTEKPFRVQSIPGEKIIQRPVTQKTYFNNTGFTSAYNNNSLVIQGFYPEIRHFLNLAERNKNDSLGDLRSLQNTYEVLEQLNQS